MRFFVYMTALIGASAVLTGAFGAHALKGTLIAQGSLTVWKTAELYHLIHTPALLAACFYADAHASARARRWLSRACTCWGLGIGLFSGSLYWMAVGGPHWLGPVTPFGGLLLIAGWLCVIGAAPTRPAADTSA
jgi:uncharacterized membrane protein YgdD (TMEM256/DUF423 family)